LAPNEKGTLENEPIRRAESLVSGYLPHGDLVIDPSLRMHSELDDDIDAITYEVLRSKFWNLNWDHQEAIRRASGSLVVVYGYDFNTSIQTEDGLGVVFGPGNLFFAGCADLCVQWTLEHRSMNVGIYDGDVFIQDDPWVGTNHMMDAAVFAPVFVEGRLFAWVYNVVHQRELGGVEPGGFVQSAPDVYSEATFMPPTKLVERGVLRDDVLDAWVRRSRLPQLMTLETKSQLAGVHFAKRRLEEMVVRYGPKTVKGAMRQMIDRTAAVTGGRLRRLPDGVWRDSRYVAGASPGDTKLYRFALSIEKHGDRLIVSNAGTDQSSGSFNITVGVLRSCIANVLLPFLAYDQYLCGAGVMQQVDFDIDPEADLITSARHPAAVSTSLGTTTAINQAQYLVAKMLSGDEELRAHVFGASAIHTQITNHMFGVDRRGRGYAHFPFDSVVGAIGAFSFRDGIDHGGGIISTTNPVGSCEGYEREIPFLYLFRTEIPTSGAHGQWRGGCTFVSGVVGHGSSESYISSGGLFQTVTQGHGLVGGYPATGGLMWHATDTTIRDEFAAGRLPASPEELRELASHGRMPPPKKFDNRLGESDVFETMPVPGGSYGDPVLREPALVALDRQEGRLYPGDAETIYGVAIADDGSADAERTADLRAALLRGRLGRARPPRAPVAGELFDLDGAVLATVAVGKTKAGQMLGCAHCRQALSERSGSYRLGCAELEQSLPSISPLFGDPLDQTGAELVLRLYLCPRCGHALDSEICRPSDEPYADVTLHDARS
jgi:N-methylhydantoinase B